MDISGRRSRRKTATGFSFRSNLDSESLVVSAAKAASWPESTVRSKTFGRERGFGEEARVARYPQMSCLGAALLLAGIVVSMDGPCARAGTPVTGIGGETEPASVSEIRGGRRSHVVARPVRKLRRNPVTPVFAGPPVTATTGPPAPSGHANPPCCKK